MKFILIARIINSSFKPTNVPGFFGGNHPIATTRGRSMNRGNLWQSLIQQARLVSRLNPIVPLLVNSNHKSTK